VDSHHENVAVLGNVKTSYVWDKFVRVFHWTLVLCVCANFFVLDEHADSHAWTGYAACGLIFARVIWGFIGTRYARFTDFFPTFSRLKAHFVAMRNRHASSLTRVVGHNPLGALMMFALIGLVLALGVTGYLMGTDEYWGEEWLENLHTWLANTLIAAIFVHVAAAIIMSRLERVNLIRAMVTGMKTWRE
jgi:cytochrome b